MMDGTKFVLEAVHERTSPDPDGQQNNQSNVWTGRNQLKGDASKDGSPISRDEVSGIVNELLEEGKLIRWHGLLAPATDEHLEAIVENEHMSSRPRRLLVQKVNKRRQGVED